MAQKPTAVQKPNPDNTADLPDQTLRSEAMVVQTVGGQTMPAGLMNDAVEMSGAGISDRPEDSSTPWLSVLQKGSPEVNKNEPEYIPGAEAGDIMHSITKQRWKNGDPGPRVLAAYFQKSEVEWTPRGSGGGYISTHPFGTKLGEQVKLTPKPGGGKGMLRMLPGGTQLVETNYHFLLMVDLLDMAVLGCSSSFLGFSRRWTGAMKAHRVRSAQGVVIPPSFSRVYRLRTVYQKNDQGDWYNLAADDEGWVDTENEVLSEAYKLARAFFKSSDAKGGVQLGRPPASDTVDSTMVDDTGPL